VIGDAPIGASGGMGDFLMTPEGREWAQTGGKIGYGFSDPLQASSAETADSVWNENMARIQRQAQAETAKTDASGWITDEDGKQVPRIVIAGTNPLTPNETEPQQLVADNQANSSFPLASIGVGLDRGTASATRALYTPIGDIGIYRDVRGHHLNQGAAYKANIPYPIGR